MKNITSSAATDSTNSSLCEEIYFRKNDFNLTSEDTHKKKTLRFSYEMSILFRNCDENAVCTRYCMYFNFIFVDSNVRKALT